MNLTAESHRVPLSDGNSIPLLGLGTYADPQKVSPGAPGRPAPLAGGRWRPPSLQTPRTGATRLFPPFFLPLPTISLFAALPVQS